MEDEVSTAYEVLITMTHHEVGQRYVGEDKWSIPGNVPISSVLDPDAGPLASSSGETEGHPLTVHRFLHVSIRKLLGEAFS